MSVLERDPATLSPLERALLRFAPEDREQAVANLREVLPAEMSRSAQYAWNEWLSRPAQRLPEGVWDTWIIRAGRGFGKTRAGAEGVRSLVNKGLAGFITIVGKTPAEARDVMVDGPSGLLAIHPPAVRPTYEASKRLVSWPNGAVGHVRSAADPDSIRGLNSDLVWFDEPASMKFGADAWDNAMFGNRVGEPHSIITGTPRPLPWLRALEERPRTVVTTGSTYDNFLNLAPAFVELILERYENTRLGAQEIHARFLEDVEGALWTLAQIERGRFLQFDIERPWRSLAVAWGKIAEQFGRAAETFTKERRRWVRAIGVDPPGETAECGIVVATAPVNARATRDHVVVLDDRSLTGPPEVWAAEVVKAYRDFNCEVAWVEINQGDAYRAVIHNVDPTVNVQKVRAKLSKADRAEPVSVLYVKGAVHHFGHLPKLEDQMSTWVPAEGKSPDRIDALVHVVTQLMPPTRIGSASLPDQTKYATEQL